MMPFNQKIKNPLMPPPNPPISNNVPQCNCGPLAPQNSDQKIDPGTSPQSVLAKIMLICDDNTGVFFFRYNQDLYLRVVKAT